MSSAIARTPGGHFAKGTSGNPQGRGIITPDLKRVSEIARGHSEEMIKVLREIALDTNQSVYARIAAATHILDRAVGKPVAPIALDVNDWQRSEEMQVVLSALRDGGHLTREKLLTIESDSSDEQDV